jgi:hypothetical protein
MAVSLTYRPPFTPTNIPGTHFCDEISAYLASIQVGNRCSASCLRKFSLAVNRPHLSQLLYRFFSKRESATTRAAVCKPLPRLLFTVYCVVLCCRCFSPVSCKFGRNFNSWGFLNLAWTLWFSGAHIKWVLKGAGWFFGGGGGVSAVLPYS